MMKLIIILTLILFCNTGFSNTILIDSRIDYVDFQNDSLNTTIPKYKGIEATDFRIDFKGKYKKKYNYRFRYNYRKSPTNNKFDKIAPAIEYAYIERNISERISFQIGKVSVLNGGIEYDDISTDVYRYSLVGDSLPVFELGSTVSYSIENHSLSIQLINSNKSTDVNGDKSQNELAYGIVWKGNIFKSHYVPIWGYTVFPSSGAGGNTDYIVSDKTSPYKKLDTIS